MPPVKKLPKMPRLERIAVREAFANAVNAWHDADVSVGTVADSPAREDRGELGGLFDNLADSVVRHRHAVEGHILAMVAAITGHEDSDPEPHAVKCKGTLYIACQCPADDDGGLHLVMLDLKNITSVDIPEPKPSPAPPRRPSPDPTPPEPSSQVTRAAAWIAETCGEKEVMDRLTFTGRYQWINDIVNRMGTAWVDRGAPLDELAKTLADPENLKGDEHFQLDVLIEELGVEEVWDRLYFRGKYRRPAEE